MKDWIERFEELDGRLAEWNAKYADAVATIRSRRRGLFSFWKRPSTDELAAIAREAEAQVGPGPHAEVSAALDDLCAHFLEAGPQERARIRAWIGASRSMLEALWSYALGSAEVVAGDDAERRLELGLAALSIDDGRTEIEDVWRVLADLWVAAVRAGIDPRPAIARVAAVSNKGASGGAAHMRELLEGFERSEHFEPLVGERLGTRRTG